MRSDKLMKAARIAVLLAVAARTMGAQALSLAAPPAAPVKPVTETLWGRQVTDDYRYMEALDPATIAWMKAQGAYTRSGLDEISPLARLKPEVAAFSASFGLIQGYSLLGGRAFYEERAPGSDNFDLIVADGSGTRKLVDVAALRAANGGKPFAINYFLASPDGGKVAVGISEGGSEDAMLSVYRRRERREARRAHRSGAIWRHCLERGFAHVVLRPPEKARAARCADRQI